MVNYNERTLLVQAECEILEEMKVRLERLETMNAAHTHV